MIAAAGLSPVAGGYVAGAVQFDGATTIGRATAFDGVVDAPGFLLSVWLNVPSLVALGPSPSIAYQHQAAGAPSWLVGLTPDTTSGHLFSTFRSTYAVGFSELDADADADSWPGFARWVHLALAVDAGLAAGLKVRQLLVDGALATLSGYDGDAAFDIGWAAGTTDEIAIGVDFTGAMAELQLWPAWSDLADPAVAAVLRTDAGKPADPALATALLGTPVLRLSGGASAFGTNAGSGGALTTTGTLTDAGSSPSD